MDDPERADIWLRTDPADATDRSPEQMAAHKQTWERVQKISREKLSERQRLAFWLRHWWQAKGNEIADLMTVMYGEETTRNAVYTLIFEARKKFKRGLKEAGFGKEDL
jgi:DNA-directed RNA polymerase specialized sigma24 family protein